MLDSEVHREKLIDVQRNNAVFPGSGRRLRAACGKSRRAGNRIAQIEPKHARDEQKEPRAAVEALAEQVAVAVARYAEVGAVDSRAPAATIS